MITAAVFGASIPIYIGAVGEGVGRLLVLPALIVFGSLAALRPRLLFLLIVLFRASGDLLFDASKFSLGGYQIGIGGVINALVILIAGLFVVEKPDVVPKRMATLWAAFLLTALYGLFIAPEKSEGIRLYLALVSYFAIFVGAFHFVRSIQDFRFCVRLVVWSSALPVLYSIVDIALHLRNGGFRLQSTFGHPNIFAFYLTSIIALVLYLLKSRVRPASQGTRAGLMVYMALLLGLLVLTQTRSAWIACLAVFAIYGAFFERRYLVYLIAIPAAAMLIPDVRDRLLELGSGNEYVQYAKLNSFAWRRLIWESGLRWMQPDHYLLGYGLNAFKFYSPVFFPLSGEANFGAHNVYVQWLFEVGVFGLLAFLWLFGRLVWTLKLMAPVDRVGACIAITLAVEYLIVSFSDNVLSYLVFNWYFWFIAGAACAVGATSRRLLQQGPESGLPIAPQSAARVPA